VAADSVERDILIEASPQAVWSVITEPQHISRWFSDDAEVEARVGAHGTLTWRPGGRGGSKDTDMVVQIQVVEADPFRRFCFRWNHPEGTTADETNSALVEFTLHEESGGTRLRVLESNIDAVTDSDAERARYLGSHEDGWGRHLGELLEHVAAEARGAAR